MNKEETKVECQDVTVKRFVWKDGEFTCGTGNLLCALTALTETNNQDAFIDDKVVTDYLSDKGLIEPTENTRFKVVEGQEDAVVQLGSVVSDAIDEELASLPKDTDVRLTPTVLISQVIGK